MGQRLIRLANWLNTGVCQVCKTSNASEAEFIRESRSSGELLQIMAAIDSRVSLENTSRESVPAEVSLHNYTGTLSVPDPAESAA